MSSDSRLPIMEPSPQEKLSAYSLKHSLANQKFDEALQLQRNFMRAVAKMRYEFNRSLSVDQKKLLDQVITSGESMINLSFFRIQKIFSTPRDITTPKDNCSLSKSNNINYLPVPMPAMKTFEDVLPNLLEKL